MPKPIIELADIKTWAYLGLHYAEKIRGGVALQQKNNNSAILHLQKALTYWDSIISITRPLYNDMPLVHYSQQGGKETKENYYLTFHWEKLQAAVAKDIEIAPQAGRD